MGRRYSYQYKGKKFSTSVGWLVVIFWGAILYVWQPLPLSIVLELILAWLWFMVIVTFVLLASKLFRGRRSHWPSLGQYCLQDRVLPNYLDLFHQRNQQRHLRFKRKSHLNYTSVSHDVD